MAEENSFPDLNAVIKDQQTTIDELTETIKSTSSPSETIFNTSPQTTKKPTNFVVIILVFVVALLLIRGIK